MLTDIFTFLLTLEKSPNESLVTLGASQTEIAAFPPNTAVTLTVTPGEGEFAYIMHYTNFDPAMVPRAFQAFGQQLGARVYDAIVNAWLTQNHVDTYIVITKQQGTLARIQNLTPLNQYYSGIVFWLVVKTAEDYQLVREALRRLHTSTRSEELATQANKLLAQLIAAISLAQPAVAKPQPPVARPT